ncbi:glycosyltransferase family 2 protein [Alteromonas facilis]|uniref:glycosyltransferase family 2 protein n=1 Tax=Alteromonas facilis TaxID=2048004 RepID=UPI000C29111D|nr:glycosyltransferase family A protein [Alteromonas facilis]
MNKQMPLVSVVMPMYNVEKYIREALGSVLQQTYPNFEVICVDDGGEDGSAAYVESLNDPRIRVIRQQNRGLAGARNTGIADAKGDYIAFLDSDDVWLPEKLSSHVEHLQSQSRVGVSYSPSLFIDEQSRLLGIGQFPKLEHISSKDIFCRNPVGNGSAPVIRKQTFDAIRFFSEEEPSRPQFFDESLRQSEDIECWLRITLNTKWHFEGIHDALTLYRVNASGLSANLTKQYQSWRRAVEKNRPGHELFFNRWYALANAYQLRYLSRRAVQSRNPASACVMMMQAVLSSPKMLWEEPKKTILSALCAVLAWLPTNLYDYIERFAMSFAAKSRASL